MDSVLTFFSELPYSIYLKWLMLLVPAAMLVFWHLSSKRYFETLIDEPSPQIQKALFSLATTRGLMIVFLWCMLSGTIIAYDVRYPVQDAEKPVSEVPQTISTQPAPTYATPVTTPADSQQEPYLDVLKAKYEDAFLSFFYLRKCKAATDEEYSTLYQSYTRQLEALDAPKTIADDTVSAAMGSFETVYSGSPCDPGYVEPMRAQFQRAVSAVGNADTGN